jgi:hypothetical protein
MGVRELIQWQVQLFPFPAEEKEVALRVHHPIRVYKL